MMLFFIIDSLNFNFSGKLYKSSGSPNLLRTFWPDSMIYGFDRTSFKNLCMLILRYSMVLGLWLRSHVVL